MHGMSIWVIFLLPALLLTDKAESKETAYVSVGDASGFTQIAVIDIETQEVLKYIPVGPSALWGNFVLTPDGRSLLLAGYEADKIYQIDIETDAISDSMSIARPRRIAMTRDGKYILSADSRASKLVIIDWLQKQVLAEIEGENGFVSEMLITSDGRLAYLRGIVDYISVIDIQEARVIQSVFLEGRPSSYPSMRSMMWHERKGILYAIDQEKGWIAKIDSSSHQVTGNIALNPEGTLSHLRFDPCEEWLYVSTTSVHQVIDIESEQTITRIPSLPSPPFSLHLPSGVDVAFTPDGKYVYLTTPVRLFDTKDPPVPGQVWVISLEQGEVIKKLDIGFQPASIAMAVYPPPLSGDFNGDQRIDFEDFILFASVFGTQIKDENWHCRYDLTRDGKVDFADFIQFIQLFSGE